MHSSTMTIAAAVATLFTSFVTAQIYTPGAPATVYFTPYKIANCSMSESIASDDAPSSYAVTSGHCYDSPYAFESYAQATNFNPTTIPCVMSIYPEAKCQGQGTGATLSNNCSCELGPMDVDGMSFELTCGP